MDIQNNWLIGLLLVGAMVWTSCRACGDETEQSAVHPADRQVEGKHTLSAKTNEKDLDQEKPTTDDSNLTPALKKHPSIEMKPGAVVDRAKRPRNIEALKKLSRQRKASEPASSKGDQSTLEEHLDEESRPR